MAPLLLLSLLAYGLFFLGLVSLNGAVIALAIPLVLYLGEALLFAPRKPKLHVTRVFDSDCIDQGKSAVVTLSITNKGNRLEEVVIRDVLPAYLELLDGETQTFTCLGADETVTLDYTVTGKRGSFNFDTVQVTASDHLGLFHRRMEFSVPGQLLVLPKVWKLRRVSIRPLRTLGSAGPIPARRAGAGVDFFGVREYQIGDPRRWINWRVSARHESALFTNEFEQERIADVGLILDARQRSEIQIKGQSLFEHAVLATASLANAFLSDGHRVGLLVYGRGLEWTLPGYGKIQRERILQALARAKTGDSMVFESMDYLPTRLFPAKSQIVLISALCQDDPEMLLRLKARGYQVLIVSPDPITFEANALASEPNIEVATRVARVERALLLRQLQRIGIQVVDWVVDRPLDQSLHATLGRLPAGFRGVRLQL